jgi:hypothetical protein
MMRASHTSGPLSGKGALIILFLARPGCKTRFDTQYSSHWKKEEKIFMDAPFGDAH